MDESSEMEVKFHKLMAASTKRYISTKKIFFLVRTESEGQGNSS